MGFHLDLTGPHRNSPRALYEGATLTTLGLARHDVDIGHLRSGNAWVMDGMDVLGWMYWDGYLWISMDIYGQVNYSHKM